MISLGGLTLPQGLTWDDRFGWQPAAQSVDYTLGGRPVVYTGAYLAGRPITLVSAQDQGWMAYDQVLLLEQMAQQAGVEFELVIGSQTFNVIFRHQDDPAFDAKPLIPRGEPVAGDWFTVTIKLMTV